MLRRNLQLSTDMLSNQSAKEDVVFFIGKKIIKSYTGANKYAFDSGNKLIFSRISVYSL